MFIVIFFIFGLIIGSFLNVVVYRINLAESLLGRSHCPYCQNKIRWYDNIPLLSFIILRAKCRDCQEKISWQYPLIELLTGLIFAAVGNYFFIYFDPQTWITTAYLLTVFSLLLVIFVYDLRFMEIPMIIFWIALGIAILYCLVYDWMNFSAMLGIFNLLTFSGLLGGFSAFLFFFILVSISKERWMGMGDAYLAFLAGFMSGFPRIFFVLTLAFFIGSICSIILLATRRKTMKSQVPFAPFLVSAIIVSILLPQIFPIFSFWVSLFGF
jgi:leader peptidase (prepilin peptidase)/N-methyltransferase